MYTVKELLCSPRISRIVDCHILYLLKLEIKDVSPPVTTSQKNVTFPMPNKGHFVLRVSLKFDASLSMRLAAARTFKNSLESMINSVYCLPHNVKDVANVSSLKRRTFQKGK